MTNNTDTLSDAMHDAVEAAINASIALYDASYVYATSDEVDAALVAAANDTLAAAIAAGRASLTARYAERNLAIDHADLEQYDQIIRNTVAYRTDAEIQIRFEQAEGARLEAMS